MENFKKIVVALDLSDFDDHVIKYVNYFAKVVDAAYVHFLHVERSFYVPTDFPDEVKDAYIPMDEGQKEEILTKVNQYFDCGVEFNVSVLEGDPTTVIAHHLDVKSADLLVMGKKTKDQSFDVVPHKLLRKAKTSVLFVTEGANHKLEEVFIPVDFSKHTDEAVELVTFLANKDHDLHVELFAGFEVPAGYYRTGKTFEEMSEILKQYSVKKAEKYVAQLEGANISFTHRAMENHGVWRLIVEEANSKARDLVVLGSKGQTNSSAMLLGSTASSVVEKYKGSPILVTKIKGENKGLLEVLFSDF